MICAAAAILFDLDGTLVDTERESAEAMARALERGLGVEISQQERDFIIGRSWVDIYDNLRRHHPDLAWTRDQLMAATARQRAQIFRDQTIRVLPGAVAAVRRFADVARGLVTGSSRQEAAQVLDALSLADAFAVVIASEDASRSKPDPEGYRAAATALAVAPHRCVVVEDSRAGIEAGLALGARVVAVRAGNFARQDQSAAHLVIDTLQELTPALVASLLR